MPTITGTQNLTVPVSTDFVEDQWLYHGQMAGQMENRFNSHDSDYQRYSPPALTIIDSTIVQNYPNPVTDSNQFDTMIRFNTVMVDVTGMADLESNPWALTPQETGMYHFSCYAKVLPSGCNPGVVTGTVSARGSGTISVCSTSTQSLEVALTGSTSVNWAGDFMVTKLGSAFGFPVIGFLGSSCASTFTPVYARLGAYKVRDL